MALFKILKGNKSGLNVKGITNGYCYVTLDEQKMYIDHVDESTGVGSRFCLNADHADTAGTASKLSCGNVGNRTTPVYFANGVPQTCEQIKTETLTVKVNGANAGSFDGSQPVTISIDTISEDDVNELLDSYLPLSAGESKKLTGALGLTEGVMYGTTLPTTGFDGQLFFLAEDAEDPPLYVPEGGSSGHVLIKNSATDGDYSWKELVALPKGGSSGQVLVKNSTTDGDASWRQANYLPLTGGTVTGEITYKVPDIDASLATNNCTTTQWPSTFNIIDSQNRIVNRLETIFTANSGDIGAHWYLRNYDTSGNQVSQKGIKMVIKKDGTLTGTIAGTFTAEKMYGAVWNDYAEFRSQKEIIEPGYCVASADNGQVYKTTEKFQACDGIVSDTFGFAIGETDECKTPLAVAGRVLAYCEGNCYDYHSGDTVCAGPDGKVCKMTREEIREWPDRIIGIVSEIPEYEIWGDGNVPVNGRIWIKVK